MRKNVISYILLLLSFVSNFLLFEKYYIRFHASETSQEIVFMQSGVELLIIAGIIPFILGKIIQLIKQYILTDKKTEKLTVESPSGESTTILIKEDMTDREVKELVEILREFLRKTSPPAQP